MLRKVINNVNTTRVTSIVATVEYGSCSCRRDSCRCSCHWDSGSGDNGGSQAAIIAIDDTAIFFNWVGE